MLKIPVQKVVETVRTREGERVAVIRTTDRGKFRACRRAWNWSSAMRENRQAIEQASPLWFGTGFHYALEDFHGENKYGKPEKALQAFVRATHKSQREDYIIPQDWEELEATGYCILEYYHKIWLKNRSPLKTHIHNGVPQNEVNLIVEVPFPLAKFGYDKWWDRVVYAGTIDRVVEDEYGQLWLVDYKTTKAIKTSHLNNDPQVCTYTWLAAQYYNRPIAGFIYWQFSKNVPKVPRPLKNGHISVAQNMRTSAGLYRLALKRCYGSIEDAPEKNKDFYYNLTNRETEHSDAFIRRDFLPRSQHAIEAEGELILLELEDMLNVEMALYPNRNWMCGMCNFYEPCISLDDGSDWLHQIESTTTQLERSRTKWKTYLPTLDEIDGIVPRSPTEIILEGVAREVQAQVNGEIEVEQTQDEKEIEAERQTEEVY